MTSDLSDTAPSRDVTICIGPREGGGLRVWSDDLMGLILSGPSPKAVMGDLLTAINVLLDYKSATNAKD